MCRGEVDVVEPDRDVADDPQPWGCGDHLGIDAISQDADNCIDVGDGVDELGVAVSSINGPDPDFVSGERFERSIGQVPCHQHSRHNSELLIGSSRPGPSFARHAIRAECSCAGAFREDVLSL